MLATSIKMDRLFIHSRWRDSNLQPTVYKTVALPLSYIGGKPRDSQQNQTLQA